MPSGRSMRADVLARAAVGKNARHRQRRILLGQMAQHADLAVDRLGAGLEIDDLQHVFALIGGAQVKVAVALARAAGGPMPTSP